MLTRARKKTLYEVSVKRLAYTVQCASAEYIRTARLTKPLISPCQSQLQLLMLRLSKYVRGWTSIRRTVSSYTNLPSNVNIGHASSVVNVSQRETGLPPSELAIFSAPRDMMRPASASASSPH